MREMGDYARYLMTNWSYSKTRNNHGSTGTWLTYRTKKKRGISSLFFSLLCIVAVADCLAQEILD